MADNPASPEIVIAWLGGMCPVQAEGTIDGKPFYFRARGQHWSLSIGDDPIGEPEWEHVEPWGEDEFQAGYMPNETARAFIHAAAQEFWTEKQAGNE